MCGLSRRLGAEVKGVGIVMHDGLMEMRKVICGYKVTFGLYKGYLAFILFFEGCGLWGLIFGK